MPTRTFVVTAAGVGAAVLAAAGITYAATIDSAPAAPSAHRAAAPSVHRAAAPAQRPAQPAQRPAAPEAPSGRGGGGEKDEGRDRDDGGRGHEERGRIYFNERTYSATGEGCITAASGLGSSSFSIFNDSKWTVEVFRGFTCDNGAPVATVGPHGATNGVVTTTVQGGLFGDDGVVGSFRVIRDYDEW
ncbi:hypothetical protein [Streptomyces sp. MK7]|uniref:hypothetical protein n=1 Tax=Streptomyces sp. MK7 TaxID=3067635 RepID=UPI00292DB9DB|nr:hypothetical protein [Streptomyces sp. MK7]